MSRRHPQGGFTLVSAIFILVVLAALAGFIAVISTTQQAGSALDLQGARAYQAARAGIEWGTYKIWASNTSCRMGTETYCTSATPASCPTSPATFTPAAATLSGFTVTVSCSRTADPAGAGGPAIFTLTAVACNMPSGGTCPDTNPNAGNANYIERRVTATI